MNTNDSKRRAVLEKRLDRLEKLILAHKHNLKNESSQYKFYNICREILDEFDDTNWVGARDIDRYLDRFYPEMGDSDRRLVYDKMKEFTSVDKYRSAADFDDDDDFDDDFDERLNKENSKKKTLVERHRNHYNKYINEDSMKSPSFAKKIKKGDKVLVMTLVDRNTKKIVPIKGKTYIASYNYDDQHIVQFNNDMRNDGQKLCFWPISWDDTKYSASLKDFEGDVYSFLVKSGKGSIVDVSDFERLRNLILTGNPNKFMPRFSTDW